MAPRAALLIVGLAAAASRALPAQVVCDGRPIRTILIETDPLFSAEGRQLPAVVERVGNMLHATTRDRTVANDLLFKVGDFCDARLLADSERLLRARPYIRSARILAVDDSSGGAEIHVLTRDDWSLLVDARIEGGDRGPVRRIRVAEESVLGRGIRGQVRYNNEGRKPGFDIGVRSWHFLGPNEADALLGNSSVGLVAEQTIVRSFRSELDRSAWRESVRYRKDPFVFNGGPLGGVVQPVVVAGGDIGLARRFGHPGNLRVLGAVLSYERTFLEGRPLARLAADDSLAAAALSGVYAERRRVRVHLLLGARSVRFVQRVGLSSVRAVEDVRLGFEGGLVAGKSLFGGAGLQHDLFGAAEVYGGLTSGPAALIFARGKVEGRWLKREQRWDGVVASGGVSGYYAISQRSELAVSLSGDGGWHMSTPFQLLLGGSNGVRGYGLSSLPVGRRVVAHAEHRQFAGTVMGVVDAGTAAFVDVGQGWRGGVPFGEDTGVIGAVGAGLRVAFPSGSRLTYRIDLAVPLSRGAGLELRIGLRQQFGVFRGEADDVTRSREQVSSVTVFNFPRY